MSTISSALQALASGADRTEVLSQVRVALANQTSVSPQTAEQHSLIRGEESLILEVFSACDKSAAMLRVMFTHSEKSRNNHSTPSMRVSAEPQTSCLHSVSTMGITAVLALRDRIATEFRLHGLDGVTNIIADVRASEQAEPPLVEVNPLSQLELEGPLIDHYSLSRATAPVPELAPPDVRSLIDSIIIRSLHDPELMDQLARDFGNLQSSELFLIDPKSYLRTYPDLSIRPIILAEEQENRLREMVRAIGLAKIALVNSASHNAEMRDLLLEGVDPIMREVFAANLGPLPHHLRIRFDTHSSFAPGSIKQIELNGSEPQGDAVTTATLSLFKRLVSRFFEKLSANPEDIDYCFAEYKLPVYEIGRTIVDVFHSHQTSHVDLPSQFNLGILAWRHPQTRKPLSNISNTEASQTARYLRNVPDINEIVPFDPYDIVGFKLIDGQNHHIPIIRVKGESGEQDREIPIHFIRRLHGSLSGKADTWGRLKDERPEIFYNFAGVQHETFNPEGRSIPMWMWMNPLNPFPTDKILDALLTDPILIRRFRVKSAIDEELRRVNPSLSDREVKEQRDLVLARCTEHIPATRILKRRAQGQLYSLDSSGVGTLTDEAIDYIVGNRGKFVLKIDTLGGFSGKGIFVGRNYPLHEVPKEVLSMVPRHESKQIMALIADAVAELVSDETLTRLQKGTLANFFHGDSWRREDVTTELAGCATLAQVISKIEGENPLSNLTYVRETLWRYLIEYGLAYPKTIIQEFTSPERFDVIRLTYSDATGIVEPNQKSSHIVDVNPVATGTELSGLHSRGSVLSKTNITGGYGSRMIALPFEVARRIAKLYQTLQSQEL